MSVSNTDFSTEAGILISLYSEKQIFLDLQLFFKEKGGILHRCYLINGDFCLNKGDRHYKKIEEVTYGEIVEW